MFEFLFSTGTAGIIAAVFTGMIAWFASRRKYKDKDRKYFDIQNKLVRLQNQRLNRRNGKLVALSMAHAAHQIAHKDKYEHLLNLCEDGSIGQAKKRLRLYIVDADEDATHILDALDEISDVSEVIQDEDIEEVLSE